MEVKDRPVDMNRQLMHIQAMYPHRSEGKLDAGSIRRLAENILSSFEFETSRGDFKKECLEFLDKVSNRIGKSDMKYESVGKISEEVERITPGQVTEFLRSVNNKFNRAVTEPGTAVGALAAQSIGEPGTQMTVSS